MTTGCRRPSAVDELADRLVVDTAALNPLLATVSGIAGHERELPDLSPDGFGARTELARATLIELERVESAGIDAGPNDRISAAALRERLTLEIELADAGEDLRQLNVIDSPMQGLRDVFDLMPTDSVDDWSDIAARLALLPDAVAGYRHSLEAARRHGHVAARRQIEEVAAQCVDYGAPAGFFLGLAAAASSGSVDGGLPAAVVRDVERGARASAQAYAALSGYLRSDLLGDAPDEDAVGRERYALFSRYFLGAEVDLEATYHWGLAEVARIEAEMAEVSRLIVPGGGVAAAIAALDADRARTVVGTDALQEWMQDLSDRTLAQLDGTHFDIPAPIRRLDARIAPTNTGGIYYTPPSEDFSRPGTMWWSVPKGVDTFPTWREVTTVFHEGVPGHHLQCGQAIHRAEHLNRWRRLLCWVSGHGEGWALYAERLMAELGYLDDPGERLGMLEGQVFRALRVVVDIGIHLRLPIPPELGTGRWDAATAWTYLNAHSDMEEKTLRFELVRYLGWPGQAPSYKIGERIWLDLRREVHQRHGARFDLKAFHREALNIGSVGLDVLQTAVLEMAPDR